MTFYCCWGGASKSKEVKDRYWTLGRSVLLQCSEAAMSKKHIAIDGRLHAKIVDDKPPSLFWLIERTTDLKIANLSCEYAHSEIKVAMSFGSKRKYSQMLHFVYCDLLFLSVSL